MPSMPSITMFRPGVATPLAALLALGGLTGCYEAEGRRAGLDRSPERVDVTSPIPPRLVGSWRLESLGGERVETTSISGLTRPTLGISSDGQLTGSTGVNQLTGRVDPIGLGSREFEIGEVATTRRGGSADAMAFERRFMQAIERSERLSREGGMLVLTRGQEVLARFTPDGAGAGKG